MDLYTSEGNALTILLLRSTTKAKANAHSKVLHNLFTAIMSLQPCKYEAAYPTIRAPAFTKFYCGSPTVHLHTIQRPQSGVSSQQPEGAGGRGEALRFAAPACGEQGVQNYSLLCRKKTRESFPR